LVKIDVQGAEGLVLDGAYETLQRSQPAILIEMDDAALRRFGSSPENIERHLESLGYKMYETRAAKLQAPIDSARARLIRSRLGYADFLFVPRHSSALSWD
jgi:hypothetical protein